MRERTARHVAVRMRQRTGQIVPEHERAAMERAPPVPLSHRRRQSRPWVGRSAVLPAVPSTGVDRPAPGQACTRTSGMWR
jgi:hypothetical protein